MNDNNISLEVYSSGVIRLLDPILTSSRVEGLRFATGDPGGLYLDASFYISGDTQAYTALTGGQRVMLRNGRRQVYEGYIASAERIVDEGGQGYMITAVGPWAWILMNRKCNKIWADTRYDETAWALDITDTNYSVMKWNVSRDEKAMRLAALAATNYAQFNSCTIAYSAPVGTYIKRITFDWFFDGEGGGVEDFRAELDEYTVAGGWASLHTIATGTGTGIIDHATSADVTKLRLRYWSNSAFEPTTDNENRLEIYKICVYSETGAIDLPAVAGDIAALLTDLNSTTQFIDAMGTSRNLVGAPSTAYGDLIVPSSFGAFNYESYADILLAAAAFGDGLNNTWTVNLLPSEWAPVYDGKPCLKVSMYPVITDYDYAVRVDEGNVVGAVDIKEDYNAIKNYVIVNYIDDQNRSKFLTPADAAFGPLGVYTPISLKDTASIARWGTREDVLPVGYASMELALGYGKRYLARKKDPVVTLSQSLNVVGTIRTKKGDKIPVSEVEAGKRIRVENWLSDITGQATAATFLISSTDYDDESQTVSMTSGQPPEMIIPSLTRNQLIAMNQGGQNKRLVPLTKSEMGGSGRSSGGGGGGGTVGGGGGSKRK